MPGCIHHVSLTCRSLNRSQYFYSQLGFTPERRYEDNSVSILLMSGVNGARIELFCFHDQELSTEATQTPSSKLPRLQTLGITHLAIAVDDLDRYFQLLSQFGDCSEITPARLGNFSYFFTNDPDGNQVEIIMEE